MVKIRLITFWICLILSASFADAQRMQIYKGERFTLSYPSDYATVPIQNAPHMCLKLGNERYLFTASYWDKGYRDGTSIWDDEIYEACKSLPVNGALLSVDKVMVTTNQGNRRSIRVMSRIDGEYTTTYTVNYFMINDSYLYIFGFLSDRSIFLSKDLNYQKNFLKGLSFNKNEGVSLSDDFYSYLLETVKTLNAQCPVKTDEITTIRSCVLSGKTVCIKLEVPNDVIDSVDYSLLKSIYCKNFSKAVPKYFFVYLNKYGYSLSYLIFDDLSELHKVMNILPSDVMAYYQ